MYAGEGPAQLARAPIDNAGGAGGHGRALLAAPIGLPVGAVAGHPDLSVVCPPVAARDGSSPCDLAADESVANDAAVGDTASVGDGNGDVPPGDPADLDAHRSPGRSRRSDVRELVISRVVEATRVLGPGLRAVVWVRGCPLRCPACIASEDLPFEGGERVRVPALAARLNALPVEVTGLTLSGGEPMAQAAALAELVDLLRPDREWSVMSYSGFTLERLQRHGDAAQLALLARLDILVDGPYLEGRHADVLWRGSDNQRVHYLTDRHTPPPEDRGAGLEMSVTGGTVRWAGVPPVRGFRDRFESVMARRGVQLVVPEED